jgi:hypothetical protein
MLNHPKKDTDHMVFEVIDGECLGNTGRARIWMGWWRLKEGFREIEETDCARRGFKRQDVRHS